jgi:polar amino acid transport system substrate-binding protein
MKKALILLTAFAMFGLGLGACGTSENNTKTEEENTKSVYRTLDEIKDSGVLKVGVFSDKSPFGYIGEDGEYTGYDVYYANQLAEDLGVEIEFTPIDAAARVSSLESGIVDVMLANFTVTTDRIKKVSFAYPYMKVSLGITVPSSSHVDSIEEFSGVLVVVKGTTAETFLEINHPDLYAKALKLEQYSEVQSALLDGRADGWITDNTEAIMFANKSEGKFVTTPELSSIGKPDTIAPAVSKGNTTLQEYINEHVERLTLEGFFAEDYDATLVEFYGEDFKNELLIDISDLDEYILD